MLEHPVQVNLRGTALDVLKQFFEKHGLSSTNSHFLNQLHTPVELLPITSLVLKSRARKLFVIFRAFHKLWEVILTCPESMSCQIFGRTGFD